MIKSGFKNSRSLIVALGVSLLVCVAGILLLAELVIGEKVRVEDIKILFPALFAMQSVIGGQVNCYIRREWFVRISLMPSIVFLFLLLICGLLLEGTFDMLRYNLIGTGIGMLIACVFCMKKTGKKSLRKTAYR